MECGEAYGQALEARIMGFCRQEVRPDASHLQYAARCWSHVQRSAPASARFLKGLAKGARLSIEHLTLLALHEEIVHQHHCTAFAATGAATRGGNTIVGMNWDWGPNLYPWPGLLKLAVKGSPRTAAYHYPGLWASAGINEHGLAFMWTGSGYHPRLQPGVGVPTYILIAEILRQSTVERALAFLKRTKHAGSFIFFLGDAGGATAVVEGMPGRLAIERGDPALSRANHYACDDLVRCSQQHLPRAEDMTTLQRARRMAQLMEQHHGQITPAVAKRVLTDRHGPWPWLHQFPGGPQARELPAMTVDSLFAVSQDRVLWTCRGGREPGPWQKVAV